MLLAEHPDFKLLEERPEFKKPVRDPLVMRSIFDVLYLGDSFSDVEETKAKLSKLLLPLGINDAKINHEWDSIHEYRISVEFTGNDEMLKKYFKTLWSLGLIDVCFIFRLMACCGEKDEKDLVFSVIKEMKS